VKQTPLAQFYDATFVAGTGEFTPTDPALFASERTAFQSDFLANQIHHLAAPELGGTATSAFAIVNGFATAFDNRFNEFQSHSQNGSDVPLTKATTGFSADVGAAAPPGLTASQLLNRAGAMACGGCHQFSNGADIGTLAGTTVQWPSSAGFVQVTESGSLSPALTGFFLPARMNLLRDFVCAGSADGGVDAGSGAGGSGGAGGAGGSGGVAGSAGSGGSGGCGGPYGPPCPGTCDMKPRKTCCFEDSQCASGFECGGAVCRAGGEGRCEPRPPRGSCWDDSDCSPKQQCKGAFICPCGSFCLLPDRQGQCVSRLVPPILPPIAAEAAAAPPEPPLPDLVRQVDTARQAVIGQSSAGLVSADAAASLDRSVEAARAAEAAEAGAFVARRRTH